MMFLLDTCFCSHSEELHSSNILDLRPVITKLRCAITDKGKEELIYFGLDKFISIENLLVIDTKNIKIEQYLKKNELIAQLDLADQLLWILGYKNRKEEYLVLTDDGELYLNCQISSINAMRLPSFLLFLCESNELSKNQVAKCLKYWETVGRYKKRELKQWNAKLLQIR